MNAGEAELGPVDMGHPEDAMIVRPRDNVLVRTLPPGRYLAAAVEQLQPTQHDPAFLETLRPRAVAFSLSDGQTTTLDLKVAGRR